MTALRAAAGALGVLLLVCAAVLLALSACAGTSGSGTGAEVASADRGKADGSRSGGEAQAPDSGRSGGTPRATEAPAPAGRAAGKDAGKPADKPGGAAGSDVPRVEAVHLLSFERVLQVEVRSIALGQPRVAVLADEPWMQEKGKWRKLDIPTQLKPAAGERDDVRIFFGRDDKPRLMGARLDDSGSAGAFVYLRYKHDGWHAERNEIGRLSGNPPGGLFGVLGHDDPEVVCKVSDICIIKRRTGWTTIAAGPGRPRVELCGSDAWAVHPNHVAKLTADGWKQVAENPPWKQPSGFWANGEGDLWVSVAEAQTLYHHDGQQWRSEPSPIAGPRGLWAAGSEEVWLVGDGGAAHYDGKRWRRVLGAEGPLSQVTGRGPTDVWVGGSSGLWHATAQGASD